jgi:hypothetical protein
MKLGVAIPAIDAAVGGDPAALREFARAVEAICYQNLSVPDQVLGVNVADRIGATATSRRIPNKSSTRCHTNVRSMPLVTSLSARITQPMEAT